MSWSKTQQLRIRGAQFAVPAVLGLNQSFFMPCLKPKEIFPQVVGHYSGHGYNLIWAEKIEAGVLGIRVWRVG